MAADTLIANLAISHLGIGKQIADLNSKTEQSEEARTMRQFYSTARDMTLRDFAWPFATKIESLGLVSANPNSEWGYSYRYPSEALKLIRILSGARNDNRASRVPYRVIQDSTGQLILTDAPTAQMEYIVRVTDPSIFPPDFIMAMSFRLAMYGAPRITQGDDFKIQQKLSQFYLNEISMAKANAANEQQPDVLPESEFITTRDGIEDRNGRFIPN